MFPTVNAPPVTGINCVYVDTVVGVIEDDGEDALDVPYTFVAVTVNVYDVPPVNPLTVIGDVVPVPVNPLGELVTV